MCTPRQEEECHHPEHPAAMEATDDSRNRRRSEPPANQAGCVALHGRSLPLTFSCCVPAPNASSHQNDGLHALLHRCEPTSAKSRSPSDALRRIRTESSAANESSNASKRSCKEITSTAWFEVTKDANLLRSSDIEATETRGIGAGAVRDASMAHPQLHVLHRRNSSKTRARLRRIADVPTPLPTMANRRQRRPS